jgi:hypothetical protein
MSSNDITDVISNAVDSTSTDNHTNKENNMNTTAATQIITKALAASTHQDALEVAALIEASIGARHQRPLGDRVNNYGLLASSGSYEFKALEPVTNMQDSLLERYAAAKFKDLSKVPYKTPGEAAGALLGAMNYQQQADMATVIFRESNPPTNKSKKLTIVYRDEGCGMTAAQVPRTIFALGSSHKTRTPWQQGAFGLGGASTYRNASSVVLVTRRAPEMNPADDCISVAVVLWESTGKGQMAYYLTTADWKDGENRDAEPWSAPASSAPDFQPGTHMALISYGVEGFHRSRSGDEKSFDTILNTRLFDPNIPIRFTNETLRGRNEYLRGLKRRLEENPDPDRPSGTEEMLYRHEGITYKLPVSYWAFAEAGADKGARRRFIGRDHAVAFTSNGQVHHHWTGPEVRQRTKLNKLHDRLFAVVETDALPIELRTTLFTPDRSQLLANEAALQLEDQVADFLNNWNRLADLNNDLVREAIQRSSSSRSTLEIAKKIAQHLKVKGFSLTGNNPGGSGGGSGSGGRRRGPIELYPDPTTLEGPERLIIEDGKVRFVNYILNAEDDFIPTRGELKLTCDHPEITDADMVVGELRAGHLRAQISVPEGAVEGEYTLTAILEDWQSSAGGIGATMTWKTVVQIVDEPPTRDNPGTGIGTSGPGEGNLIAVMWSDPAAQGGDWNNATPGSVEEVDAATLAEADPEYAYLAKSGQPVTTVILNREFRQFKDYIGVRARELGNVDALRDRYALSTGLGLIYLDQQTKVRIAKAETVNEAAQVDAKQAIARSVLSMMPQFDVLTREAGIVE